MNQKSSKIFRIFGVLLLTGIAFVVFYFSPISNLIKKAPESLKQVGREVLMPGPLTSEREKEIKETLSDDEIIKITNEYRKEDGKNPLRENELLNKAAMARIDDMFLQQYFEHVSPQGTDVSDTLKSIGYSYVVAGENLALGYFSDSKDLVDAWMASPGHRENILKSEYREIGVAHKIGIFKGKKQYLAVQVFATSTADCPLPSSKLKKQISEKKKEISSIEARIQDLETEINNLKNQISVLSNEINNLISEGQLLINQGNHLIAKGNQVYRTTKDKEAAEDYWNEGEKLQEEGQTKLDLAEKKEREVQDLQEELQVKINHHNAFVKEINTKSDALEKIVEEYNRQVNVFNKCAGH